MSDEYRMTNSLMLVISPKTDVVLENVVQFHRLILNWYWHSSMLILAPAPTAWSNNMQLSATVDSSILAKADGSII